MTINQLGVIGLGTMGANIARNAARNGAKVAVYNRTKEVTKAFMNDFAEEGNFVGCETYEEMMKALHGPRAILIMVKAGAAIDAVINDLIPHLTKGDIIIDGGNSYYKDTERRVEELDKQGIRFLGMGVSGGEEGALHGPSMMPGGDKSAWEDMKVLLEKMAADDGIGGKCVAYIGKGGSGHFVKMVHNGIEYGIMQLIAETYDILKNAAGYTNAQLAETFAHWNDGDDLQSFLVEITAKIFQTKDPDSKKEIIDSIDDVAGQKGTGKWTTISALEYGVAIPTINAAVDARIMSGSIEIRKKSKNNPLLLDLEEPMPRSEQMRTITRSALYLSTITAYEQGFTLMETASADHKWELDLSACARIWLGGCIIRSVLLKTFTDIYSADSTKNKTADAYLLRQWSGEKQTHLRLLLELANSRGIPTPSLSASMNYYDTMRRQHLPQSLVQAQRDLFGAHTFKRTDKEGTFHIDWS